MSALELAKLAQAASVQLKDSAAQTRNAALLSMALELINDTDDILWQNSLDIATATQNGRSAAFIERLTLNPARVAALADGLRDVAALPDPIGEITGMRTMANGLLIGQKRVPLGVVGVIFESRPNVTSDAAALCVKSGNACVLRGGSDALKSNLAIANALRTGIKKAGLNPDCVNFVNSPDRAETMAMMRANGLIDVLIPRGGKELIQSVVQNATVPVIETGTGNCHVYVDGMCSLDMALDIAVSAKISRPSVCNAAETLLIDRAIADSFLPECLKRLNQSRVQVRGCAVTQSYADWVTPATEDDYYTEFNDLIYAVKVVDGLDAAIDHIERYSTRHSDAIITDNYHRAQTFVNRVDSAAVYVNASTRFTDGGEFGLGAEIGISNQKLHVRGPIGVKELTSLKYIIYGNGQTR